MANYTITYTRPVLLLCCLIMLNKTALSQTESNGWLSVTHRQKLAEKWILTGEVQLRSADQYKYLQNILLRPSVGYNVFKNHTASLGYCFFGTWEKTGSQKSYQAENRLWEQYSISAKIKRIKLENRLRLEQRFAEKKTDNVFSQRLRYYLRAEIPVKANKEFSRGLYMALQNEVFLNIQNKQEVNNNLYDQNRTMAALGFRVNKGVNIEAGYMFRYQLKESGRLYNHIFQLALMTEL